MKTIENEVKKVLEKYPETRNSDMALFAKIAELRGYGGVPIQCLNRYKSFDIPNYDTVGRARRKLQSKYQNLRAVKEVEDARAERELEFREYARS